MRVYLCALQGAVTQKTADVLDVHAAAEQMRSYGVAKRMKTHRPFYAR